MKSTSAFTGLANFQLPRQRHDKTCDNPCDIRHELSRRVLTLIKEGGSRPMPPPREEPRTLLERLKAEGRHTWPELEEQFLRHARALGENVSVTWRHLQRLAAGETARPGRAVATVLERQFGRPIEELLGPPVPVHASTVIAAAMGTTSASSRHTVGAVSYPPSVSGSEDAAERGQEEEDVERRRFLSGFAALGLAGSNLLAGVEVLRHDLLNAMNDNYADLDEWNAIAWEYGLTYPNTPPQVLLQQLAADLFVARGQLPEIRDQNSHQGLQRVIAQLSAYMAQTMGNLGNSRESLRWWRIARRSADASGDAETRVWVRGREIVRGLYEHRPVDSLLRLADEAMAISDQPGMGTGAVLSGRAQALAMLGRADEAREAMADVYDAVDRLPARITSDTGSMYGWSEYRLRHAESFVYTHTGDKRQAEAAQERAIALFPTSLFRERAQVQLHRAMRLIKDGDPGGGSSDAVDTLTSIPEGQRIAVVMEVARWVAATVPVAERSRREATELHEFLALPAGAPLR